MRKQDVSYENLYAELEGYERLGIHILIDGNNASPMQVVRYLARENGSYMRDYEINQEGYIESLSFINIDE